MIDFILKEYNNSLRHIRRGLLPFLSNTENVTDDDLKKILRIETRLMDYINAIIATASALEEFINKVGVHKDDLEILEDLEVDAEQIIDNAKSVYKIAQNIRSTHELISSHQLNATMKVLTSLTVLLAIPTVISGFFGMNVWLPVSDSSPLGFFAIGFLTALAMITTVYIFNKKGWM